LLVQIVEIHPDGGNYPEMIDEGKGELVAKIFREAKTEE
jgi:hypothetical protein